MGFEVPLPAASWKERYVNASRWRQRLLNRTWRWTCWDIFVSYEEEWLASIVSRCGRREADLHASMNRQASLFVDDSSIVAPIEAMEFSWAPHYWVLDDPPPPPAPVPEPEVVVARGKKAGNPRRRMQRKDYRQKQRHGAGAIHSPSSRYRAGTTALHADLRPSGPCTSACLRKKTTVACSSAWPLPLPPFAAASAAPAPLLLLCTPAASPLHRLPPPHGRVSFRLAASSASAVLLQLHVSAASPLHRLPPLCTRVGRTRRSRRGLAPRIHRRPCLLLLRRAGLTSAADRLLLYRRHVRQRLRLCRATAPCLATATSTTAHPHQPPEPPRKVADAMDPSLSRPDQDPKVRDTRF
ncbi:hypothetical protein BS78_01G265400 [Paspalum vaginatum]|nr:hypothetical protein BS78_01G265400 [Paspalum vaginatum]